MKLRLTALALILTVLGMPVLMPLRAAAMAGPQSTVVRASNTGASSLASTLSAIPISGSFGKGAAKQRGTFSGLLNIQHFADQNGTLVAVGILSGVFLKNNPHKTVLKTLTNAPVSIPVKSVGSGAGTTGSTTGATTQAGRSEARPALPQACQILNLVLGPLNLNLLGLQVNLNQVVLNITAIPGAGNLLGNLLCGIANLLNPGSPLGGLAGLLNGLLQILRPTTLSSPFSLVPVSGTTGSLTGALTRTPATQALNGPLSERGSRAAATSNGFVGLLTIQRFANQNGKLVAVGTITGVSSAGKAVTNAPATLPVTATTTAPTSTPTTGSITPDGRSATADGTKLAASCPILYLNLAPTSLNLLGLQVNLSQVILTITAQSGAGNLLGNLLCDIANLLNPGSLGALVQALTNLLDAFRGTISAPFDAIPVSGATATGHGTFTGLLNIQSFASQGGKLVANGTLSGVLSGGPGNTGGVVVDKPVSVPVNTSGGSTAASTGAALASVGAGAPAALPAAACPILHLNLGPLSLNLLGLQVNLNRVVLTITAQSGPGNLLGNLLCGLVNLLNPGPLNGLLQLFGL